jgi:hypothetical protein
MGAVKRLDGGNGTKVEGARMGAVKRLDGGSRSAAEGGEWAA